MARSPKRRLDDELVIRGLAEDLRVARGLIMAGKVVVDDAVCSKAGTSVAASARVHVRGRAMKFVSRGGYKLEAALERFGVEVDGRVALDAGASTGGFTDCLLQRGAARVYAVDVGFGQLRGRLSTDPRVVNLERTNISDVRTETLSPGIDLAVADLSNLSLRKAIPILCALFTDARVELVVLVKPLFEGLERSGMESASALLTTVEALMADVVAAGLGVSGLMASPIRGGRASVEFLAWLRADGNREVEEACRAAVAEIPSDSTE
ncbi:MAG: TlyA family RNA methyltransferase [Deltaproteobacteria bacterium]|jgi:23S rRNA (cytidine1920-2'-O)/16S rRNA (cytidine1409-2'-O)-methyltransferase